MDLVELNMGQAWPTYWVGSGAVFLIELHGIGTFINSRLRAGEPAFGTAGASPSWRAPFKTALTPTALNVLSKSPEAIENGIKTPGDGQAGS